MYAHMFFRRLKMFGFNTFSVFRQRFEPHEFLIVNESHSEKNFFETKKRFFDSKKCI